MDKINEKCSKPHISSLPYDLRTNDQEKLQIRRNAIRVRLTELKKEIDKKEDMVKLNGWYRQSPKDIIRDIINTADEGEEVFKSANLSNYPEVSESTNKYFDEKISSRIKENSDVYESLKEQLLESIESGRDVVDKRLLKQFVKNSQRLKDVCWNLRINLEFDYSGKKMPRDLSEATRKMIMYANMNTSNSRQIRIQLDNHERAQSDLRRRKKEIRKLKNEYNDLLNEYDRSMK